MKSHTEGPLATSPGNLPNSEAFELVLNNLEDHFLLIDSTLHVVLANKSTVEKIQKALGVTIEKGMSILEIVPEERRPKLKLIYDAVLKGEHKVTETVINFENEKQWFQNSFMPAYNKEGVISGVIVSSRNITERKKAEREQEKAESQLRLSEFQYRSMFNSNPLPCYIYSTSSFKILQINEAALRYYGVDIEELDTLTIFDLHHPNHLFLLKQRLQKETASLHHSENAWKIVHRDGQENFADLRISAVLIQNEEARLVVTHDVTAVTRAEIALRASNERFNLMARAASEALWEWNEETGEAYISPAYLQLMGWNPEEFRKLDTWPDYIHPEDRDKTLEEYTNCMNDPHCSVWKSQYRYRRSKGDYAFVNDKAVFVRNNEGKVLKVVGALQDITERKTNELLLSLERSVLELSTDTKSDIEKIVHYLLRGIEQIDTEASTMVLIPAEKGFEVLTSHKIPSTFIQAIKNLPAEELEKNIWASLEFKKTFITPDIQKEASWNSLKEVSGIEGIQSFWSFPVISSTGTVLGVFNVFYSRPPHEHQTTLSNLERLRNILRVIMEQQWSVKQLKLVNERFDKMMKATHDLIWDWNLITNTIYRDPEVLLHVFGIKDNKTIENFDSWSKRVHKDDRAALEEKIRQTMDKTGKSQFEAEYRFQRADGSYAHIYDRGILLRDETGKPIRMIGAAQDISDRKRLEKELLSNELEYQKAINKATVQTQEQERSEIGKDLHDNVNQVLTTTKLYLDLAMSSPEMKDDLIRKSSSNIISVINEIRQLSRSLMDPSIGDLGLTDSINDLIDNINLTRKLHVTLHADQGIDGIIDQNQKLTVFRIIQEALNNAVRHSEASEVIIRMQEMNSEVRVSIEDNGIGFDPRTTKRGAGLKNIQNRIYLINGRHAFESSPSNGSKIIITFPIIQS